MSVSEMAERGGHAPQPAVRIDFLSTESRLACPVHVPLVPAARVALAPPRLKVEHAAVDTTKPFVARDVMFIFSSHAQFLSLVVALRIERSATRLSDAFERPALDYRAEGSDVRVRGSGHARSNRLC